MRFPNERIIPADGLIAVGAIHGAWQKQCRAPSVCRGIYRLCGKEKNEVEILNISKKRIAAERLPAVPLITCYPYFSLWSGSDALFDTDTMHWTGRRKRITGTAKIDGVEYRFLGRGREPAM